MNDILRIGALISGSGTNLQAIIDACAERRIDGELAFVGSDNPNATGLARAAKAGIATFTVDYATIIKHYKTAPELVLLPEDFDLNAVLSKQTLFASNFSSIKTNLFFMSRAIAEAQLLQHMRPYEYDLLVLAGFMRTLTPYFLDQVNTDPDLPRAMNIHPALLPAFRGSDGYGDTYRYGCKLGGCTVHFVDYGEDSGPIIGQKAFPISSEDTLETIKKKGLKLEWELYPECIQLYAQDRLRIVEREQTLKNGKTAKRAVVQILRKT